uniref:Amidase domain-containing protein n=1 Tax=Globodera pallida TaxID=36090 RepID=A0A183BN45_GLOPA
MCPLLPLPPQPILTHQFNNPIAAQQLAFIHSNYSILASSITELETQGLALPRSVDILSAVKTAISKIGGAMGARIDAKFDAVLTRNPGIGQLVDIAKVIDGENNSWEWSTE